MLKFIKINQKNISKFLRFVFLKLCIQENEKPVQAKEETGGIKFKKIGAAKDKKEDPSKTYMEPKSVGNAFKFDVQNIFLFPILINEID